MILVTGSTGKVGKELVRNLQETKVKFRVGARSPQKVSGTEVVLFDLDRPETFGPALAGIEKLFLLSSGGTEREGPVVDAAKKAGVSEDDYRKGVLAAGIPPGYANALVDLQRYYVSGGASRVTPDVERVTGRKPIGFDQFTRDHADSWK